MRDEDVLITDFRYLSEVLLLANVSVCFFLACILYAVNYTLAMGVVQISGAFAVANIFYYRTSWSDSEAGTRTKFLFSFLPYIALLVIAGIAAFSGIVAPSDNSLAPEFYTIDLSSPKLIVSAAISPLKGLYGEITTVAVAALALSLFFITDSRYVLKRILAACLLPAALLAILGFTMVLFDGQNAVINLGVIGKNSFSVFVDSAHWAAFAILWLGVAFMVMLYQGQRFSLDGFVLSKRFLVLAVAVLLYASVIYVNTAAYCIIASLVFACGMAILAVDAFPDRKTQIKYWPYPNERFEISPKIRCLLPCVVYALLAATGLFFAAKYALLSTDFYYFFNPQNSEAISVADKDNILADIYPIIKNRQWFGWGVMSFPYLYGFFQGADMGQTLWGTSGSSLLDAILQRGYVGVALCCIVPLIFAVCFFVKNKLSASVIPVCIGLLGLAITALFANSLQSPLVCLSYMLVLFAVFSWGKAKIR